MKGVFFVFCMMVAAVSQAQSWTDDWFDNYTSSGPSSFENQKRGFYSAGSFQGRWRMSNDHLMTLQPPRLKVGCGGIDGFLGGMSFLNADYLVEKLQRILQAAPALAFDLALSTLCEKCAATMNTLEQATNVLNSIQVNDCRMSQRLVQAVSEADPSLLMDEQMKALANFNLRDAYNDNYHQVQERTRANGGVATRDTRPMIDQCPAEFRQVFGGGSVIGNTAGLLGLNDYSSTMRGILGDVIVSWPAAQTMPAIDARKPCQQSEQFDAEDFLRGEVMVQNTAGVCTAAGGQGIDDIVRTRLESIVASIRAGTALSADDRLFVENAPLPVNNMLRDAVVQGIADEEVDLLVEPLATAYAYRVLDDLYKLTTQVVMTAKEVSQKGMKSTGNPDLCDTRLLNEATMKSEGLLDDVRHYREVARASYVGKHQEMVANLNRTRLLYDQKRQGLNALAAPTE